MFVEKAENWRNIAATDEKKYSYGRKHCIRKIIIAAAFKRRLGERASLVVTNTNFSLV